jgi:5-methylcytosine-specific restriction endonuclease McrA
MRRRVNPSKALFSKKVKKVSVDRLRRKTDKLLQLHYTPPGTKCIVCGALAACCHHFIPKSQSNYLRYHPDNLIPICSRCHTRHHFSGDPAIVATIISVKGLDWWNKLQKKRLIPCKLNLQYLKIVIASFS